MFFPPLCRRHSVSQPSDGDFYSLLTLPKTSFLSEPRRFPCKINHSPLCSDPPSPPKSECAGVSVINNLPSGSSPPPAPSPDFAHTTSLPGPACAHTHLAKQEDGENALFNIFGRQAVTVGGGKKGRGHGTFEKRFVFVNLKLGKASQIGCFGSQGCNKHGERGGICPPSNWRLCWKAPPPPQLSLSPCIDLLWVRLRKSAAMNTHEQMTPPSTESDP